MRPIQVRKPLPQVVGRCCAVGAGGSGLKCSMFLEGICAPQQCGLLGEWNCIRRVCPRRETPGTSVLI